MEPKRDHTPICPICASPTYPLATVDVYPLYRCRVCHVEFLHPQPDDTALNSIYGRHYYAAWGIDQNEAAVRALKMATFRRRLVALRDLIPASGRVLDVGCATGYFLEVALEFKLDPYGVELSAYGAEVSRRKTGHGHVFHGRLEDATFINNPEGIFDAIFMSDLIEHVRDPRGTLAAASARLRCGGLLVITTPWTNSLSRQLAGRHWLHYKPEHLFYFGTGSIGHLIGDREFKILRREAASKCLSLGYARAQFSSGSATMRILSRLLNLLPQRLLDLHIWVLLGEATLVAQKISDNGNEFAPV